LGKNNPPYFQMVTNLYIPEHATPADQQFFKDLQGLSVSTAKSGEVHARVRCHQCAAAAALGVGAHNYFS